MSEGTLKDIPLTEILMDDDFNCRGAIAAVDVADLARDIDRRGLIQPVVVEPCSAEEIAESGCKYKLLAGYRRATAHKVLGKKNIQCIIRERMNSEDALFFNLAENVNRTDLTVLQEAKAMSKLKLYGVSRADAAERLGKSHGWIQIRFMLLDLPEEIQQEVEAGFISQTQIRELYTILGQSGREECFAAARELKDAKLLGKKNQTVNPNKLNPKAKRHHSRKEILDMLEHIYDIIGPGLHTRTLAWAAGEISTTDLDKDLKEECEAKGKIFRSSIAA